MSALWDWVVTGEADIRVGVRTSRREQTTSTVIIAGTHALLVDPAWDPDELAAIAADLAGRGLTPVGFATHVHHDHLLWHPALGNAAPRWASGTTARLARSQRAELLHALGPDWPPELADVVGAVTAAPTDLVPWDGPEVRMITHDAHAPGHTALWLPAVKVLIAGDMLSDVELPLLEESTPAAYRQGLTALRPVVERATTVIPGHGSVAAGSRAAAERWRADDAYLRDLVSAAPTSDARLTGPGMRAAHQQNQLRVPAWSSGIPNGTPDDLSADD